MNKQEIVEYNNRQILLMEQKINFFKKHQISINDLMNDISGLLKFIKNPPTGWARKIDDLLWEMEIIYATTIDQERSFAAEETRQILNFLDEIDILIRWYRENYLPLDNDSEV